MQTKKVIKSVSAIIVLGLVCKVLGFVREILIARNYGAGADTDAYFLASTVITMISVISTPIASAVIPMLTKVQQEGGIKKKHKYTSNLTNIMLVVTGVIMLVGFFVVPYLVQIMAHGFFEEQYILTVQLIRIGLPTVVLSALMGIFRGYLQSEGNFLDTAISDLILNAGYLIFLLFFSVFCDIRWLMVTVIVSNAVRVGLQLVLLRKLQYHHTRVMSFGDQHIRETLILILPIIISVLVNDLNQLIDKSFAAGLDTGTISALNYASKTNNAIMAIFITSMVTVLFPNLASAVAKGERDELRGMVSGGLRAILVLTIPATVGLIFLAQPVVKLAFERGAFDGTATQMTADCLIFYSVGLVGMSLRAYLERAFYAAHDTKTPMLNAVAAVIINVLLNFILIRFMVHKGLAMATSMAAIVASLGLLVLLRKKVGSIGLLSVAKTAVKSVISAAIMGVAVLMGRYFMAQNSHDAILEMILLGLDVCIGGCIYTVSMILMKEETFIQGGHMLKTWLER